MSSRFRNNESGFTILELLISIALLVIISFSIYQATTETYKLRDVLQNEGEFHNGVRMAMSLMNRDITLLYSPLDVVPQSQSLPKTPTKGQAAQTGINQQAFQEQEEIRAAGMDRPSKFWGGAIDRAGVRPSRFVGTEDTLSFISTSHIRVYKDSPESEFAKITYELKDDEISADLGLPEDSKVLVKTEDPDAFDLEDNALVDSTDDEGSLKRTYPLIHGIRTLKFRFYWKEKEQWLTSWDSDSSDTKNLYPDVIEVTVEVDGPSRLFFEGRYLFRSEVPFAGLDAQI